MASGLFCSVQPSAITGKTSGVGGVAETVSPSATAAVSLEVQSSLYAISSFLLASV